MHEADTDGTPSRFKVVDRDQPVGLSWNVTGNSCGIIPISSIFRRVHVMPAFEPGKAAVQAGLHHLNPFKW
jgi:hypothetical protein